MSSTSSKIPRPPPSKRKRKTNKLLHQLMQTTHPTIESFKEFKKSAVSFMEDFGLVDAERRGKPWRKFVSAMLSRDPLLDQYQDAWPLEYYHSSHNYYRAKYRNYDRDWRARLNIRNKKEGRHNNVALRSITNQCPPNRPRATQSTAQHPSPVHVHDPSSRAISLPYRGLLSTKESRSAPAPAPAHPPKERPRTSLQTNTPSKPLPTHKPTFREPATPITINCIHCPASTKVADPLYNLRLREAVDQDPNLLQELASIGVYFDQHLDLLRRADLRLAFFKSLGPDRIDHSTKMRLFRIFANSEKGRKNEDDNDTQAVRETASTSQAKAVTTYGYNKNWSVSRSTSTSEEDSDNDSDESEWEIIPAPTPMEEEGMITVDYPTFKAQLQILMQLEDDKELFDQLKETMKMTLSWQYFETDTPDATLLREIIHNICTQQPNHFEAYKNYWPIKIFLNRLKAKAPSNLAPQYSRRQEVRIFAEVFNARSQFTRPIWPGSSSKSRSHPKRSADPPGPSQQNRKLIEFENSHSSQLPSSSSSSMTVSDPNKNNNNPRIEQIPCAVYHHPPAKINASSIPSSLQEHLHAQGMGELIPFLASPLRASHPHRHPHSQPYPTARPLTQSTSDTPRVDTTKSPVYLYRPAIETNLHFALFRQLSKDERLEILDAPALKGKLGDFQRFLFGVAF